MQGIAWGSIAKLFQAKFRSAEKLASGAKAGPILLYLTWRNALKASPNFAPSPGDVRRVPFYIRMELRLLIAIIVFAAIMARYTSI